MQSGVNSDAGPVAGEPAFEKLDLTGHRWKKALLEAFPDATFLTDDAGRVLDCNSAAARMLGYNSADLVDRRIGGLFRYDKEEVSGAIPAVSPDTFGRNQGSPKKAFCDSTNGTSVSCEIRFRKIPNQVGRASWLVTACDTSIREFEQARMRESLKTAAAADLAARIANDFNNQLAAISGNVEAIRLQLQQDGVTLPSALAGARDAVESAARIVRRLESIARPAPSRLRPIDPLLILDRAAAALKAELPPKIDLTVEVDHGDWIVNADADQIGDTILNMAMNARDAMPAGGLLSISTKQEKIPLVNGNSAGGEDREYVRIDISDTGCGISREVLPRIFDAFFTTRKAAQGAGLGLAGVYNVLSQHEGGVRVESTVGAGTTFHIFLPRASGVSGTAWLSPQSKPVRGNETVLLIDDEASVRSTTRSALEHFGYRVVEATDGIEGLQLFGEAPNPISIAVLDIMMPEMTGWDVLAKLKSKAPDLPVILMSGLACSGEAPTDLSAQADAFLRKPFELLELTNTVRKLLDSKTSH